MSPFCGAIDTPVLDFWWCPPLGFKARVDPSLASFVTYVPWIPEIHLWCDTCWLYRGQHGSPVTFPTCYICSRGRLLGFDKETSPIVSGHAVHSATATGSVLWTYCISIKTHKNKVLVLKSVNSDSNSKSLNCKAALWCLLQWYCVSNPARSQSSSSL